LKKSQETQEKQEELRKQQAFAEAVEDAKRCEKRRINHYSANTQTQIRT
jgi:hypothetical protein